MKKKNSELNSVQFGSVVLCARKPEKINCRVTKKRTRNSETENSAPSLTSFAITSFLSVGASIRSCCYLFVLTFYCCAHVWAEVMFGTNEMFVQRTQRRDTYFQLFCGKITRSYLSCVFVCGFWCWYRCNSLLFHLHVNIVCFVTSVTVVCCYIFHSDIYLNLVSCFSHSQRQYFLSFIQHCFGLHVFKSLLVSVSLSARHTFLILSQVNK